MKSIDNCVCERIVASEQVHAVQPIKSTLEDMPTINPRAAELLGEVIIEMTGQNKKLLADCEALNDEIEHLKAVAQRAQAREVQAVKRFETLEKTLIEASLYIPNRYSNRDMLVKISQALGTTLI